MTDDLFGYGETRICHTCQEEKHKDEFYNHRLRPGGKSCYCIPCSKKHGEDVKELRKTAPPQPIDNACQCCGRKDRKLLLDHCHDTITFRGWICGKCNTGLGSLGDTLEDVKKALRYLENIENEKASIGHRDEHATQYDLVLCDSGC